jgi:hypothetical protein
MWNKTKVRFRIVVLCLIALFVLLPLLSSPVAATIQCNRIGVISDNAPGGPYVAALGPSISYDLPGSYPAYDDNSGVITFTCDCYQIDTNPGGQGSVHYMELNVQKINPRPFGSLLTTSIYRALNPGQTASPYPTQLQITTNYTVLNPPPAFQEVFVAYVYAEVTDNQTQTSAYNTFYWYFTIQ